jgi:uncharacterized protein involved in exopolysaccharide biosynthesis/Mrp family chromosome partitioning ATPase
LKNSNLRNQRINPLLALKRQSLRIIILSAVTFLAAAPLVYLSSTKVYTAVAELRIDPTSTSMNPGIDGSNSISQYYDAYVSTQKFKILKRQNIALALNSLNFADRYALIKDSPVTDQTIDAMLRSINVVPARDSLILSLQISGGQPKGLAEFLNALIDLYLNDLKTEKGSLESGRIDFTVKKRQELETQISMIESQLMTISQEIATGNFKSEDIPYKTELKIQEETRIRAENDRILKEKIYNQFLAQMKQKTISATDTEIEAKLRTDSNLNDEKRLVQSRIEATDKQLSSLSTNNSSRRDLEITITGLQDKLKSLDDAAKEKYRKQIESEARNALEDRRKELFGDYQVALQYEQAVKDSYNSIQSKYSFVSKRIMNAQSLQNDLTNLKGELAKLNSNINYFRSEQESSGLVTVENSARPPVSPEKSNRIKNLAVTLAACVLLFVFLALALEFFDFRVKSAEELRTFTGIKPSWPISHYKGDKGEFQTVTLKDQDSVVNKAIRSLATRINKERLSYDSKVVAFSAINSRAGTSEILLNCAHQMKMNCERVLLIDLAHEHDGIADKLGIPMKEQSLVRHIEGGELKNLVRRDPVRDIDLVTILDLEQLDNKNLDRLLDFARKEYDIVLLDTAPVLKSLNTEHIFMKSDSVVFIVRGYSSTYPDLRHTLELAEKFGVKSVALVLNWWKPAKAKRKKGQDPERDENSKPTVGTLEPA